MTPHPLQLLEAVAWDLLMTLLDQHDTDDITISRQQLADWYQDLLRVLARLEGAL